MKTAKTLMIFLLFWIAACTDPVDKRFEELEHSDLIVWELLNEKSQYSGFTNLIKEIGYDSLLIRNASFSLFAVDDEHLPDMSMFELEQKENYVRNHISNFVLYSSGMNDGHSLKMLSGKYLIFSQVNETTIVNDVAALINSDILAKNGVIHGIDQLLDLRPNLLEYIQENDDYSYLADFFNTGTAYEFDEVNSIPIGINDEGQTIYDTVWKQSNGFFEQYADLSSEDERYTMFLADNILLDTSAEGSFKFGYLANPGSFILDGLFDESSFPGSFSTVTNFTLDMMPGNFELLEKLSNGYAYALKGFEGIRIPRKINWEVTDVSDFDSIRQIKSVQYAEHLDQLKEISITDLEGNITSFKYFIFSGPLNKDYLQIITEAGTSANITFDLPDILPGKYLVRLGAQIRRVDGLYFDVYLNDELIASNISLNGGEYNWDPIDLGPGYIDYEKGNTITFAVSGSNNNYVRGYFDYLEFEPVN